MNRLPWPSEEMPSRPFALAMFQVCTTFMVVGSISVRFVLPLPVTKMSPV